MFTTKSHQKHMKMLDDWAKQHIHPLLLKRSKNVVYESSPIKETNTKVSQGFEQSCSSEEKLAYNDVMLSSHKATDDVFEKNDDNVACSNAEEYDNPLEGSFMNEVDEIDEGVISILNDEENYNQQSYNNGENTVYNEEEEILDNAPQIGDKIDIQQLMFEMKNTEVDDSNWKAKRKAKNQAKAHEKIKSKVFKFAGQQEESKPSDTFDLYQKENAEEEMKMFFGDKSDLITNLEANIQLNFEEMLQVHQPDEWPVVPLNFKL